VTDFAPQPALTHLTPAETHLSAALAQPRRIAILCVVALTGLGWVALGLMAGSTDPWLALCAPLAAAHSAGLSLVVPMWMAMTLAMMLPTAGPMILTYAEIADTAARQREAVVSPLVLTAGYVSVWLGFALAAALLQLALIGLMPFEAGHASALLASALFVIAGVYQFSDLKQSCLTVCQRPFPFFFANWTTGRAAVFRLGLRQGLYCLGCCWAMMLLMLATGTMNVLWMAALGIVMTIEKMSQTVRFTRGVGMAFIGIGMGFLLSGWL
jgi:predicted metal-binding membrane protein